MTIPPEIREFWNAFETQVGGNVSDRFYEVCIFDDNEASADELAQLVLAGIKRATAGLVWSYEASGMSVPTPGILSVVTNWAREPLCIIETTSVEIVPFENVTAEFAATEGEGDGSLAYWQRTHWAYFTRECQRIGRQPTPTMPIACERFKVVHPLPDETAA